MTPVCFFLVAFLRGAAAFCGTGTGTKRVPPPLAEEELEPPPPAAAPAWPCTMMGWPPWPGANRTCFGCGAATETGAAGAETGAEAGVSFFGFLSTSFISLSSSTG